MSGMDGRRIQGFLDKLQCKIRFTKQGSGAIAPVVKQVGLLRIVWKNIGQQVVGLLYGFGIVKICEDLLLQFIRHGPPGRPPGHIPE